MATKLTRTQQKDYIRSIVGEFDSKRINDTTLNADINFAQRKIQLDTLEIGGIKQYTKQAFNNGYISAVPSDMLFHPNAIIDIEASTGGKSFINGSFFTNSIVITAREPGTSMNGWVVTFTNGSSISTPYLYDYSLSGKTISIFIKSGTTTMNELIALATSNLILKELFVFTSSATTDTVTLSGGTPLSCTLADGTGAGWYYAEEVSIEEFNRTKRNTYQAGTSTEPKYRRLGDSIPNQNIEFYPTTIKHSKIYYHYLLADLTADTDTTSLPAELEELLLIELQRRVYIYLKQQNNSAEQNADYVQKLQNLDQKYQNGLAMAVQDKKRIAGE